MMKHNKLTYMVAILAAMTATSCSNDMEEKTSNVSSKNLVPMTFTATQEESNITRTALSYDDANSTYHVNWQDNDAITLYDGTGANGLSLASGAGTTSATFSGSVNANSTTFTAVYPNSVGQKCTFTSDEITGIVIPSVQTATLDTYDHDAAVMTAYTTNNSLSFLNVCSFLKITTTRDYYCIMVSVASGNIAGTFSCSNYGTNPTLTATDGKGIIVLKPDAESTAISAGTYYIAIAPGQISGLTVDCYTAPNTVAEKKNSSLTTTFVRSKCYSLGSTETWAVATPNLLLYTYSVSDTKKVLFTKGNLYCETTNSSVTWGLEQDQLTFPDTRDTHIGHFFWAKTAAASYANSYSDGTNNSSDKLWCDGSSADHMLTIAGTSGLYVLSIDEWEYLLSDDDSNTKRYGKYNPNVEVDGNTNCCVIAPDEYTGSIKSSYTADEWAEAETNYGLICLPSAGWYRGSQLWNSKDRGSYWSSTTSDTSHAFGLIIDGGAKDTETLSDRRFAYSIRLVWTYSDTTPSGN